MVLLEGGGGQDGFRVEQAGKLGDEGFALFQYVLNLRLGLLLFFCRLWCNTGCGRKLRVCMEESIRLDSLAFRLIKANKSKGGPGFLMTVPADGAVPNLSLSKLTL